jgi:hypothetical protein
MPHEWWGWVGWVRPIVSFSRPIFTQPVVMKRDIKDKKKDLW